MNVSSYLKRIPEFSDRNFVKASYVCGGILSAIALFFMFEMFTVDDFGIKVQWNIFRSAWFSILFPVGFILAIVNWGKFGHWSFQTYDVYKDDFGNKYTKKNNDMIETMFNSIIMPILGHFVIEPIVYACFIYYPLMCVFALIGVILPYALSLLLIGLSVAMFYSSRYILQMRYRSLLIVCVTVLVGGGLLWASINMEQSKHPQTIMEKTVPAATENGEMFEESKTKPAETDEMFKE